ncbi:bifunctional Delta-aminolevulinic acid dehydratase/Aldolase-type TIM barrel [Babesia duncani]|uniref:porphobilinogen synthase n=1 Tax=Babesia duncani TaxID=323732 RepID=A0AAD9PPC0_9APIC|nr:bifunctional Delta-aminolevulinic acid dehydratase/Aldolase-type TIM barrel [Babesia duncani]
MEFLSVKRLLVLLGSLVAIHTKWSFFVSNRVDAIISRNGNFTCYTTLKSKSSGTGYLFYGFLSSPGASLTAGGNNANLVTSKGRSIRSFRNFASEEDEENVVDDQEFTQESELENEEYEGSDIEEELVEDDVYDEADPSDEYDSAENGTDEENDEAVNDGLDSFDFNTHGEILLPGINRLAKYRQSRQRRKLFKENYVSLNDMIYPLYLHNEEQSVESQDIEGFRLMSVEDAVQSVGDAVKMGISLFILYPSIEESLKGLFADEGLNSEGLIPRAIMAIKDAYPQVQVIADVSLSHYTNHGHDGIVEPETNFISNDISLSQIGKQACTLAYAGCDVVALSDLADGAVAIVREALDYEGFTDVIVMSKAAKFNSVLMTDQNKLLKVNPSDEVELASYLNDPSDSDVAIAKGLTDIETGADMIAIEPAGQYLDIVRGLKDRVKVPVVAIQTPGEVNLLRAGARAGVLNEQLAVVESLRGFKRAGADLIITPYAKQVATWLLEDMEQNGVDHVALCF